MSDELNFIRRLKRDCVVRDPVIVGIGDDGAVVDNDGVASTIVVTDMLLDRVHFDCRQTPAQLIGRKALAVNLSDLAAMGCRPTAAFVSLALPRDVSATWVDDLYQAMHKLAEEYDFTIAGGDTNVWSGALAVNVCLTGVSFGEAPVLRSTAQPGDVLYVTGALGGSLPSGRHLTFVPALQASQRILEQVRVHAMMDISDGLAIDVHRLLEASGVGADLMAEQIPIHSDVAADWPPERRLQAALSDGEDFELLLAVPVEQSLRLEQLTELDRPVARIGQVTEQTRCRLHAADGTACDLPVSGWQHLQSTESSS